MKATFIRQWACSAVLKRPATTLLLGALALGGNSSGAQPAGIPSGSPGAAPVIVHPISVPFLMSVRGIDDAGDIFASGANSLGFIYDGSSARIATLRASSSATADYVGMIAFSSGGLALTGGTGPSEIMIYDAHAKTFKGTNILPVALNSAVEIVGMNDSLVVVGNLNRGEVGKIDHAVYGKLSIGEVGGQIAGVDYKPFECPDHALMHAEAINNRGQIVGTCQFVEAGGPANWETRGFLFNIGSGSMTTFSYPGAKETHPTGINDRGAIVGYFMDSFAPGHSRGSFLYNGAQFEQVMPNEQQRSRDLVARGINNLGDIAGTFGSGSQGRSFIAVPAGATAPRVVSALNFERLSPLTVEALKREPDEPSSEQSARARGGDDAGPDPNFTPPGGNGRVSLTPTFVVSYLYRRADAQPEIQEADVSGSDIHYMGFNAEGSWFRRGIDALVYVWNRSQRTLSCTTNGVPPGLRNNDRFRPLPVSQLAYGEPATMQAPTQGQAQAQPPAVDLAAVVASVQPPAPAGFAPYGQNATITRQASGTMLLSYTLKYPGIPDSTIQVPVVRPLPKSPATGLPIPVLPESSSGSWLWFGDGAKKGTAVFFSLDGSGHLTWLFMPSDIAAMYLPPGAAH